MCIRDASLPDPRMDDAHGVARSSRPTGGSSTTRPPSISTSGTMAVTNGTSAARPSVNRRTNRSWAAAGCREITSPTSSPETVTALSPTRSLSYQVSSSPSSSSASASSLMPRSASAPLRSSVPSKPSSRTPLWSRALRSTIGPASPGSVTKVAPGTKRSSAAPVRTCTVTSPRSPCAFPIRATTTCMSRSFERWVPGVVGETVVWERLRKAARGMPEGNSPAYPLSGLLSGLSLPIRVDDVDPYRLAACEGGHHGAQCACRSPRATDDTTEVVWMNPDLENLAATQLLAPDGDIFVMIDNALDEVLERILEHDQASALASSDASATSTTGASTGDSTFSTFSTLGSALSAFSTLGSALSAFSTLGSALSAFSILGSALSACLLFTSPTP